jgi:transketolase N-terminal domain/subunit
VGRIRLLIVEARDGHKWEDNFYLRQVTLSYLFEQTGWEERFAESTLQLSVDKSSPENLQTVFGSGQGLGKLVAVGIALAAKRYWYIWLPEQG